MNVIHVVRQFHPSVGGLEDVVLNLAAHQAALPGRRVKVVTLDRLFRGDPGTVLPARDAVRGVDVVRIPYSGSTRYPLAWSVLSRLGEADLVHVHAIDFFFDYLALTQVLHGKPLVASTHGGFFHTAFASGLKQRYFSTVTRWSARRYRKILATSVNDGDIFARIVSPPRLEVIENGVDIDRYRGLCTEGVPRALVYFGRWSANKGLPETIALLAHLRRLHPDWTLTVAGREYDLDLAEMARLCRDAGVEDAVTLRPGPSNEELSASMASAGYFCSLSRHEGFGLTAVESMAAGLFPLLSDIPAYRRLIEAAGVGRLIDGDLGAAAGAIEAHHQAVDAQREVWRARARQACEAYRWSRVSGQYEAAYAEALRGEPAPQARSVS